jgi:hypothetical protein
MRVRALLERLSAMGAEAQASVPALYAWGVTVAPVAWGHGATVVAKVAAGAALGAIGFGVVSDRVWGGRWRFHALWGFVLASALTWSCAPAALGPLRVDAARGIAGMLGWALFALTSAAPAIEGGRAEDRLVEEPALPPRRALVRGDALYVGAGLMLAALLQVVGWRIAGAERALLVRLVAIAGGIAVLGVATHIGLARHLSRARASRPRRIRRAMAALGALALLSLTGLLFALRD